MDVLAKVATVMPDRLSDQMRRRRAHYLKSRGSAANGKAGLRP